MNLVDMSFVTLLIFAAFILQSVEAERAAERIQQARYCAAVERRAQYREVEIVQQVATEDVKPALDLSSPDQTRLREALDRLARCSTRKLVYDPVVRFYVPQRKKGCQ